MLSHPPGPDRPVSATRTPPGSGRWRPWRTAWLDAAYGAGGFWTTEQPGGHFATAVGAGRVVAEAVAGLVPSDCSVVVDVGAGDARLLVALAELLPGVGLVGVDRRPRPPALDPRVRWFVDHHDVTTGRWARGGPPAWTGPATPLLVAHEWLDDLPVPVVGRGPDGWREVEVDPVGRERPGPPVDAPDAAWLGRWWPDGDRAEVGHARDVAWTTLVDAALARGGRALAVDYGHRAEARPTGGSFAAYGSGRRRTPVPDGSVNLTAGVAVDALVAAGEAAGAATLLLGRQAEVLAEASAGVGPDGLAGPPADPLAALVRRSERSAVADPAHWGGLWWLLQGAAP